MEKKNERVMSILTVIESMKLSQDELTDLVTRIQKHYELQKESVSNVVFPLPVRYQSGNTSAHELKNDKPIGIVISFKESSGFLRGSHERSLLLYKKTFDLTDWNDKEVFKSELPAGYNWHIASTSECEVMRQKVFEINKTLALIGGVPFNKDNYVTADKGPRSGPALFVAEL